MSGAPAATLLWLMFILYNGNGDGSLEARLLEKVNDPHWFQVRAAAARSLRITGKEVSAKFLKDTLFELWKATNGFGDEFEVIRTVLPLAKFNEMELDVDSYSAQSKYFEIFEALNEVGNPVRFIGMDAAAPRVRDARAAPLKITSKKVRAWLPDRWTKVSDLSSGGQGWTYLVRKSDGSDDNLHVFKRIKNEERSSRFEEEIDALTQLSHPGILKIVEHGFWKDKPYYVSEYCEGGDLGKFDLSKKNLREKLSLYREICDAIGAAHANGRIHRDIKPANILLKKNGVIVVGDFGLSFNLNRIGDRLTESIEAVGARSYMAPELEDGRAENPKPTADVYSLGKLLYFLVAGRVFMRERHRESPYFLLESSDVDPYIHFIYELLDKTIVANPEGRYPNASELRNALDGVIMKVEQDGHVLNLKVAQRCLYCVTGEYRPMQNGTEHDLKLICWSCGNIQNFGPPRIGVAPWWRSNS
jgi:hypothetical protein